ncbi:MAG: helix-turn-helix domain-containing protein [Spirochaetaceae bacterium]|nr:helix-turn-helix domain-containing protein [Spirochaetaceae bacterium]
MEDIEKTIVCPGDTLQLIMSQKNISKEELAKQSGVKLDYVDAICQGVSPIRKFYADKLSEILDIDAQFWLTLQSLYENELKLYGQLSKNEDIQGAKE